MLEVFIDSLLDTLKIGLVVFVFNVIISLFSLKLTKILSKNSKLAPLYASLTGIIPECGISVAGTDLFINNRITSGTLIAIYLSCSDEAIPLLIGGLHSRWYYVLFLILIKIIVASFIGYIVDLILKEEIVMPSIEEKMSNTDICSKHHNSSSRLDKFLFHPLIHTLKLLIYIFVVNFLFGVLMFYFSDQISLFLEKNRYLSVLVSAIIGLIPNCASSVVLTELFIENGIGFGALVSGLMENAGLGLFVLLKNKPTIKKALLILLICFITSVITGYIISLIIGF